MEGEVVDCVSQDGFLYEEDVAFCFFDLLDQVEKVGPFFFKDFVHLSVVVYDDLVLHVWFGGAELKLYQAYASLFHSSGPIGALDHLLVQDEAVYHFAIFDRAADFFDDTNIL